MHSVPIDAEMVANWGFLDSKSCLATAVSQPVSRLGKHPVNTFYDNEVGF